MTVWVTLCRKGYQPLLRSGHAAHEEQLTRTHHGRQCIPGPLRAMRSRRERGHTYRDIRYTHQKRHTYRTIRCTCLRGNTDLAIRCICLKGHTYRIIRYARLTEYMSHCVFRRLCQSATARLTIHVRHSTMSGDLVGPLHSLRPSIRVQVMYYSK